MTRDEIKTAIISYCEIMTEAADNEKTEYLITSVGRKYTRVIRRYYGSDSAHCFVSMEDGSIWKPASWKAPAKNFSRGSVFNPPAKPQHFVYGY